jgi:hypothetical protein
MIGMSSVSFLLLPGIGWIVALVLHSVLCRRFLESSDAVFAQMAMGWMGARLRSPVRTTGRTDFRTSAPHRRSY